MSDKKKDVPMPILLNGKLFSVDPSGTMAITTDGKAIRLSDPEVKRRRFG